jgi:hypothetical protein
MMAIDSLPMMNDDVNPRYTEIGRKRVRIAGDTTATLAVDSKFGSLE